MSEARGFSLRGWAVISGALLLVACQPIRPAPTPTPAPSDLQPRGATEQATVTEIVDGDTIRVEIGGVEYRVRYIGIDAPEVAHDDNPGEWLGAEAAQANAALVDGQLVILEKDVSDTDQFGRLLRYVWLYSETSLPWWTMVNLELAADGMADAERYTPDTYWQDYLWQAEDNAREADLGIWSAP